MTEEAREIGRLAAVVGNGSVSRKVGKADVPVVLFSGLVAIVEAARWPLCCAIDRVD